MKYIITLLLFCGPIIVMAGGEPLDGVRSAGKMELTEGGSEQLLGKRKRTEKKRTQRKRQCRDAAEEVKGVGKLKESLYSPSKIGLFPEFTLVTFSYLRLSEFYSFCKSHRFFSENFDNLYNKPERRREAFEVVLDERFEALLESVDVSLAFRKIIEYLWSGGHGDQLAIVNRGLISEVLADASKYPPSEVLMVGLENFIPVILSGRGVKQTTCKSFQKGLLKRL